MEDWGKRMRSIQSRKDADARHATRSHSDSGRSNWERPRVLFREPLEAVAVACVPTPPGKPDPVQCASPQS